MEKNRVIDGEDEVSVAAELGRRLALAESAPRVAPYCDAAPFLVLRDKDGNERVEYVSGTVPRPPRPKAAVTILDVESFIAYVLRHKVENSSIYATMKPAAFVAVLNDTPDPLSGGGDFRDHRASFTVAHSREWSAWTNHNGSGAAFNSTESFALFLEENAPDIVKPDAAHMLSLALNFRVTGAVNFVSANRLQDGNVDLVYSNTVDGSGRSADGKKLKLPELFEIEVPVFAGIERDMVKLQARFRYRLGGDGRLALWYELVNHQRALEDAFRKLWARVKKETGVPMFLGTP